MFVVHVNTVHKLRTALLPLATICPSADLKCSTERFSIIVVPTDYPFVTSLRMLPCFFNAFLSFSESDLFPIYRRRFNLRLFTTNISNLHSETLAMTVFIGKNTATAPIKFEDPNSGYVQFSVLLLSNPKYIDISPIDFGVFVAIRSLDFINLVSGLVVGSEDLVCITVTQTEAKFSALTKQVTFKTQNSNCIIVGVTEGSVAHFVITLTPTQFFYHVASGGEFVWILKTVSSRNLLSCCLGIHASYLVCF